MAAAKTQRDVSGGHSHHGHHKHHPVMPPKVLTGPQIMGKGSNKIDILDVQTYLHNLKLQNAAGRVANHSQSSQGLKITH